jgi:transposase InsO family protein
MNMTGSEARQGIFEYIEVFYNRKRRHAFLNFITAIEFEVECVRI